ncbi:IS110 family RNA-guided transposase [Chryseobacterium pennipullorum]|uniref:IS110 family transposase n=1 Tax=Chryseobacterium pennipullorum TaxID=2258963 RepID=A0A3D9AJL6_9FLAO|nr:IS110 family transposase [Chryseobacterium pennipullorum]REC41325.1 IS110 family transposase [Chryseobacterium pennipullorum]
MKTYFIGIDISKDTLDICIINSSDEKEIVFKIDNTVVGIEQMLTSVSDYEQNSEFQYCFENTGNYGLLLARMLEDKHITYYQVPALEIKLSQGIQRGKNDQVDAKRIARYAKMYSDDLKPSALPDKELFTVKNLLTYRSFLIKVRTQFKNEKKSFYQVGKVADVNYEMDEIAQQIKELDQKIAFVESKIKQQINEQENLNKNYEKITRIKGVGFLTATYMLVLTDNFTKFKNPRKFNCYAGLAPFEHTSGSSIKGKTKTSKLRNRKIKTVLFSGANSAIMYDEELKTYYKRKKLQGKAHNSIINAVCCKLIYRIFAVVKREEPFVNLTRYNLHMS